MFTRLNRNYSTNGNVIGSGNRYPGFKRIDEIYDLLGCKWIFAS